jgi:hypothetical protein
VTVVAHHRLNLEHRGAQHAHPFWPRCICGWQGVQRRRRKEAEAEYRAHRTSAERKTRRKSDARTVTPVGELPEELQ